MQLPSSVTEFEGNLPKGGRLTFQLTSNAKMFEILSDGIYSDKAMAVIRELCCNAHDSTVTAGHGRPFVVNVPTSLDSNFWVEDTGLGINPDKIVDIFWTYGASTKTHDNTTIGALGLGSKSPFAYTKSSFLVINRYNGIEYKYFCFINEVGIPDGKMIFSSPTDEPNGVRVELAVRSPDISVFRERIIRFFSFWEPKNLPKFTGDSTVLAAINKIRSSRTVRGDFWELRTNVESIQRGAYAVMGGVPYPINLNALRSPSTALTQVCGSYINITFPMGSLEFQVSREELAYTEATIKALEKAAAKVIKDVVDTAAQKLVDLATPYELAVKFNEVHHAVSASFQVAGQQLLSRAFTLTDGRRFAGRDLCSSTINAASKAHEPFSISLVQSSYRSYTKGTQHFALESVLNLDLTSPEVKDANGVVTERSYTNSIPWFSSLTKPVAWVNTNRKRTVANYLHAGFAVTGTSFNRDRRGAAAFIINDLEDRGTEGIRFYNGTLPQAALEAMRDGQLFFISAFDEGKSHADAEAALKKFFADTLFDGAPIFLLSKLPNFKLPVAPVTAPKPRAPIQRGTVEIRVTDFTFPATKRINADKSYDSFDISFEVAQLSKTQYARHELAKPLLYVVTNWGTPLNKTLVDKNVISAFRALGVLDQYLSTDSAGNTVVRVAMLPLTSVDELKRRKVELMNVADLAPQVESVIRADAALIAGMQARIDADSHQSAHMLNRLMGSNFTKHTLPKLSADNVIAKVANVHKNVTNLLKGQEKRGAALFLVNAFALTTARELLDGKVKVNTITQKYAFLDVLVLSANTYGFNVAQWEHLAAYINMIDAAEAAAVHAAKEQARLDNLANLHAEALFEMR